MEAADLASVVMQMISGLATSAGTSVGTAAGEEVSRLVRDRLRESREGRAALAQLDQEPGSSEAESRVRSVLTGALADDPAFAMRLETAATQNTLHEGRDVTVQTDGRRGPGRHRRVPAGVVGHHQARRSCRRGPRLHPDVYPARRSGPAGEDAGCGRGVRLRVGRVVTVAFRLRTAAPYAVRLARGLGEESTGRADRAGLAHRTCRFLAPPACKAPLTVGREEDGAVHAAACGVGLPLPHFEDGFGPYLHENLRSVCPSSFVSRSCR